MKKRFFSKGGAQSSIETILIVAMALFILTALVGITYDQITSFRGEQSQKMASIAVSSIVKEVNDVYFSGPGTVKTIVVRLPQGIDFEKSSIEGRTILLNVWGSDVFSTASVDVRGVWPGESGTYSFTISSYNNYVSVSTRPVDVTPNNISEYLIQGESKEFSITLYNGSDLDKYYSMVIDFPSPYLGEVSLSSTHEGLVEVFYGETQLINYSISCGLDSFGSYNGEIVFIPNELTDSNITIPVNLFCSSLQTKLKTYPSTKSIHTIINYSANDSVLVCNTTSRDFTSVNVSLSGEIASFVVPSSINSIKSNSCETINLAVLASSSPSTYGGVLLIKSGGYSTQVDLNLVVNKDCVNQNMLNFSSDSNGVLLVPIFRESDLSSVSWFSQNDTRIQKSWWLDEDKVFILTNTREDTGIYKWNYDSNSLGRLFVGLSYDPIYFTVGYGGYFSKVGNKIVFSNSRGTEYRTAIVIDENNSSFSIFEWNLGSPISGYFGDLSPSGNIYFQLTHAISLSYYTKAFDVSDFSSPVLLGSVVNVASLQTYYAKGVSDRRFFTGKALWDFNGVGFTQISASSPVTSYAYSSVWLDENTIVNNYYQSGTTSQILLQNFSALDESGLRTMTTNSLSSYIQSIGKYNNMLFFAKRFNVVDVEGILTLLSSGSTSTSANHPPSWDLYIPSYIHNQVKVFPHGYQSSIKGYLELPDGSVLTSTYTAYNSTYNHRWTPNTKVNLFYVSDLGISDGYYAFRRFSTSFPTQGLSCMVKDSSKESVVPIFRNDSKVDASSWFSESDSRIQKSWWLDENKVFILTTTKEDTGIYEWDGGSLVPVQRGVAYDPYYFNSSITLGFFSKVGNKIVFSNARGAAYRTAIVVDENNSSFSIFEWDLGSPLSGYWGDLSPSGNVYFQLSQTLSNYTKAFDVSDFSSPVLLGSVVNVASLQTYAVKGVSDRRFFTGKALWDFNGVGFTQISASSPVTNYAYSSVWLDENTIVNNYYQSGTTSQILLQNFSALDESGLRTMTTTTPPTYLYSIGQYSHYVLLSKRIKIGDLDGVLTLLSSGSSVTTRHPPKWDLYIPSISFHNQVKVFPQGYQSYIRDYLELPDGSVLTSTHTAYETKYTWRWFPSDYFDLFYVSDLGVNEGYYYLNRMGVTS